MTARSMTGFGAGTATLAGAPGAPRFRIQLRSVNHRFLDLKLRLGRELLALEAPIKARLKHRLARGHVEVIIDAEPGRAPSWDVQVDEPLAKSLHDALRRTNTALGFEGPIQLAELLRFQEIVQIRRASFKASEHVDDFLEGLDEAVEGLVTMRAAEGANLARDLHSHIDALSECLLRIRDGLPGLLASYRARLERRLADLLQSLERIDNGRFEQEVAYLVERSDVSEELARFESHIQQFRLALDDAQEGQPRGKRLEFLTIELLREVNTIGSKIGDADLTAVVIDAKCELEKVREQVANLE